MRLPPALDRRFRLIAFDWDGTAVHSRADDASPVRGPIERLLRRRVPVVVVTGTHLRNIDGQLSRAIRGPHKQRLFLATNRGSEVYGFDREGAPTLRWKRTASAEEERLLSEIAEAVRAELVARTGLEIAVIHDRLNRRKIDLIPLPAWRDPPKSRIGELLAAVQARLTGAGLAGGLAEAFVLCQRTAREHGLTDARITSDVKHLEVGLTDKSDTMRWVVRELCQRQHIAFEDVLVGGDELGDVAGFEGSDARMRIPELGGAVFVSVGPEPGGAPAGVVHLGGGPERFQALLEDQAARHPVELPDREPAGDARWELIEDGWVLEREHEVESLFALGNGHVGTRGSLAEGSPLSAPATFVAGIYEVPGAPEGGEVPALLVLEDWARIEGIVDGYRVRLDAGELLEQRRTLDLRRGQLWRFWRHRDPEGRVTTVRGLRLVSRADPHVLLQSLSFTPENWGGRVQVRTRLSRTSITRTSRGAAVAVATGTLLETPARLDLVAGDAGDASGSDGDAAAMEVLALDVQMGRTYRLDRVASVHSSRESAAPERSAVLHLDRMLREQGVEGLVRAHRHAWAERWRDADVRIDGDLEAQRALRFAAYHLLSAANAADEGVSIGARAMTGGGYKGHVFWDTEIFMLPFFTLVWPEAARALLRYRHRTLPAARARAASFGYRGALYAWESADTGEDVTPPFMLMPDGEVVRLRVGEQEQHISADVAYAVWSYWQATGDESFLLESGAEILLETARFWASRVVPGDDGRDHILGVIGPDEYHESVDDSAYTNVMAQWNLERGAELVGLMERRWPRAFAELARRIGLQRSEPREWLRTAARLYTGLDPRTGLIEQFRGYFQLEDPLTIPELRERAAGERRHVPAELLIGRERVHRSQLVKQADVVMLLHLLWDRFPPAVREACFGYYEPRTDHASSLSPPVHALVAARLGELDLALRYFRQTAEIDLANNMGNAAGGVHAAALGGLWQAAVLGFAGLRLTERGPAVEPRLPAGWSRMRFAVRWHGRRYTLEVPAAPVPARAAPHLEVAP